CHCEVAETCTGSTGASRAHACATTASVCSGASNGGDCDATDHCSGTANTCVDEYKASSFVCRASAGQCDVAETCTGSSGACPAKSGAASGRVSGGAWHAGE